MARRAWALPLPAHLAVLAIVVMAWAPMVHLEYTFTADEGTYAIQTRSLDHGSWAFEYAAEELDPEGEWLPLLNGTRGDDGWFAYVKHPAYPMALLAATRLVGDLAGLHLLSLIGALGVAAAAWLLAAEWDARVSRTAFWIAAASPVAVHASLIWAHAPAAAASGLALLAAVRLVKGTGHPYRQLLLLIGGLSAAVLLRSEGLILVIALAIGLVLASRGRPALTRLGLPGACLAVGVGLSILEERWISSIIGRRLAPGSRARARSVTSDATGGIVDWLGGRLGAAWRSLLRGSHLSGDGNVLVLIALVLIAWAVVAGLRGRAGWRRDITLGLGGGVCLYGVRALSSSTDAMTGLVAAWPVVLFALAVPLRRTGPARLVGVTTAAFSAGVLVTQYRSGGGFEWGGRFFFPVLVPLAAAAGMGLERILREAGPRRRLIAGLVVAMAFLPVLTGLAVIRTTRPLLGQVVDEVATGRGQLILTHSPALPPAAWRAYPGVGWAVASQEQAVAAASVLRAHGPRSLLVVVPESIAVRVAASFPGAVDVSGPAVVRLGWRTVRVPAAPS